MWSPASSGMRGGRPPVKFYQMPGVMSPNWNEMMHMPPPQRPPQPRPYNPRNAMYEPLHPRQFNNYGGGGFDHDHEDRYYDSNRYYKPNNPDVGGGGSVPNMGAISAGGGNVGTMPNMGRFRGQGSNYRGGYNNNATRGTGGFNRYNNTNNGRGGGASMGSKPPYNGYNNTTTGYNSGGYNSSNTYNNGTTFQNKQNFNQIELKPIDFTTYKPPEVNKMVYTPSTSQMARSPEEINKYREEHRLQIIGKDIPSPILEFSDYPFPDYIRRQLDRNGIEIPTPIQSQTWPVAFGGRDFIGISQTGSGKTLAFMLPAITHINNQPKLAAGEGPVVLVMAPTRELANQILSVSKMLGTSSNIRSTCVYGGASRIPQIQALRAGVEICIATPGRLIDFLNAGETNLLRCSYLVLDEADRMLDMGFEPQIRQILSQARPDRQTLMFSATWPQSVQGLSKSFLKDHVQLNVGSTDLSANPDIGQHIHVCTRSDADARFFDIVDKLAINGGPVKVLMFMNTKRECNEMSFKVNAQCKGRYVVDVIHGDKSQNARDYTLRRFRNGACDFLIATEVAARGIDVIDITHVINYGFPNDCEQYIHRIGRTARQGRKGESHTLIFDISSQNCSQLITVLTDAKQKVNADLHRFLNPYLRKRYDNRYGRY